MATQSSFDIVSEYDASELDHAIDQARRELTNRYDFKGSAASLDYSDDKKLSLTIEGESDYQLQAIIDMVRGKLAKRNLSQKILDTAANQPQQAGMILRHVVPFQKGIDQERAKKITKSIREKFPKVKTQIQGEEIRVTSASKDELQAVMQHLRSLDLAFPISFTNFR